MTRATRSSNEHISMTCAHCGASFRAEVWRILDAEEHPAAAHAAHQGCLNLATCPHCGTENPAGSALLFHDGPARLLVFVTPTGVAEVVWREQARDLHTRLAHALPDGHSRPYLGDVRIAQDMAGLAHVLAKQERRLKPAEPPGEAEEPATLRRERPASRSTPENSNPPTLSPDMINVVQRLMSADSPGEFRAIVEHHPFLLEHEPSQALKHFADMAFEQRDYDVADCLAQICQMLQQMRQGEGGEASPRQVAPARPDQHNAPHDKQHNDQANHQPGEIPGAAYQALLQSRSTEELLDVLHDHPILLEPWVDSRLSQTIDRVVAEEYERLALALEHRREQLVELRHQLEG